MPGEADIAGIGERLAPFDLVVVGTFAAHLQPAQAALAAAVLAAGKPTVTVALRTPWDLLAYPVGADPCLQLRDPAAVDGGAGGCAPG